MKKITKKAIVFTNGDPFRHSKRAVCGHNEREIMVPMARRRWYLKQIKRKGYTLVGQSIEPKASRTQRLWYLRN